MTRLEYNRIVDQVEARFEGRPQALTNKLLRMIALGYGYLLFVLLLSLATIVVVIALVILSPNILTVKLGLVFGIVALVLFWSILKAFWVRTERPKGIPLKREEAPALFDLLDELRREVANVSFNRVLIDGDFNAAVVQIPRLGIFGWYRSYLLLGLPLLQGLEPGELRAVLAHEFAHLSNKDGAAGTWLYRTRRCWERAIDGIATRQGTGSFALVPFLLWFWPRFDAHAFVLSRLHEYRADATAARFAGASVLATALQRVELRGRWVSEEVWDDILLRANDEAEVPAGVYAQVRTRMAEPIEEEKHREWLQQAFLRPTDRTDTHPALQDRLRALRALPEWVSTGQNPGLLPPLGASAATAFLGHRENDLVTALSEEWRDGVKEFWTMRHEDVKKVRARLGPESEVRSAQSAWKWVEAMLDLEGVEAALPWIEKTLYFDPRHTGARFVEAQHLLEKGDSRGVALLEALMAEDQSIGMEALEVLRMHFVNTGQADRLAEIDRKADEMEAFLARAGAEREALSHTDVFLPPELSEETLTDLRRLFAGEPHVLDVHIARKQTVLMSNVPMYAVALTIKAPALKYRSDATDAELINRLLAEQPLVGSSLFFVRAGEAKKIGKAVAAVPGSLVYRREKS